MYVCICVCVYIYIYIYIYIYTHTYIYTRTHTYTSKGSIIFPALKTRTKLYLQAERTIQQNSVTTNPTQNYTSNCTLLCYIPWNRSRYCFNTTRSMKENVLMEVLPSPNDASHPFHWGDLQGRGAGRRMAAIEGSDRNPTAIQSYFQKLRTPDNERPSASCTISNASFRLRRGIWPVQPFTVLFAVQFKNYKYLK